VTTWAVRGGGCSSFGLNQDWFMLKEFPLAAARAVTLDHDDAPLPGDARAIEAFLQRSTDVDLAPRARCTTKLLKGISVAELNRVATALPAW